jgi:molybdenum cofactor biosynthesis protein B
MSVEERKCKAQKNVKFAVVTVSDTRTQKDDLPGAAISAVLESAGHKSIRKVIVKNDVSEIQRALREMIEDPNIQAIVMNGGTGVSKRDVTVEAVSDFIEKPLPGFGEIFRTLSFEEIGSTAMMSRALGFVSEGKIVFCLPGSEKAVRLATGRLIAPELGHLVWEAGR